MVIYRINSYVTVSIYFDQRRALAMSLITAGVSFGFFIWAPLFRYFIIQYGRCGAMILFSTAHLHCIAAGLLLRAPPQSQKKKEASQLKSLLFSKCAFNYRDYMTLSNLRLLMVVLSISLMFGGHIIPYYFLPARVMSDLGVPAQKAALLVSILGIGSTLTRPIYGLIGDKIKIYR